MYTLAPRRWLAGLRLALFATLVLCSLGLSIIWPPRPAAAQPVIFGDGLVPAPASDVPAGTVVIGCTVGSGLPLDSFQISVDGAAVPTSLGGTASPWTLRGTATLLAGSHVAAVFVTDSAGQSGGWTWQFTVSGSPPTATATAPPPTPLPTATPAPPPGSPPPHTEPVAPAPGWMVPEGTQRIGARFSTDSGWRSRVASLDGQPLALQSEGVTPGGEVLSAAVPVTAGVHAVMVQAIDVYGRVASSRWQFYASGPANAGAVRISPLAPTPGSNLARGTSVHLAARLETTGTLKAPALLLDGTALPLAGGAPQNLFTADATGVAAGEHSVRAQASDDSGQVHTVVWTFSVGPPGPGTAGTYFPQTGFLVAGPFDAYRQSLGTNALTVLGLPISGLLVERLGDGHDYTVQYFERVRLEWHPDNRGSEFEVLYGLLGTQFHRPDPAIAAASARVGAQFFPETGHLVSGPFLQKWQSTGGLRVHGYPISEELQEVSATDGRVYLVQYFQRARFEYHPENAGTPFEVLLGMLGRQLWLQRYPAP